MEAKPKVYFTKIITPEKLVEMYKLLGIKLTGKIGVKVHTGEKGSDYYIRPDFFKPMVDFVDGTIIEGNSSGPQSEKTSRTNNEEHKKLLEEHGWTKTFKKIEILDSEKPDEKLEIPNGICIKENYIGSKLRTFDSLLVLSHFKGHPLGGFGGALKQLSIGCASRKGKTLIHSAGKNDDPDKLMTNFCPDKEFKQAMADAASSVFKIFKGKSAFINTMVNLSIDCDCVNGQKAPTMKDIGILSSLDPVALDQACLDLIYKSEDEGKKELIERIEKRLGPLIIDYSVQLGTGKKEYELINID